MLTAAEARQAARPCGPWTWRRRVQLLPSTPAAAAPPAGGAAVTQLQPGQSLHAEEAAIACLGTAYMAHPWQRQLRAKPGREADLFAGLARAVIESARGQPVVYCAGSSSGGNGNGVDSGSSSGRGCDAAALLLSSEQSCQLMAQLRDLDFEVVPGTLQMLRAVTEGGLAEAIWALQQREDAARTAAAGARHLRLMLAGVHPDVRGRALGGTLLAAAAAAADAQALPLVAELDDSGLAPLLQRHGFAVAARVPYAARPGGGSGDGPAVRGLFTTMLRSPRHAAGGG